MFIQIFNCETLRFGSISLTTGRSGQLASSELGTKNPVFDGIKPLKIFTTIYPPFLFNNRIFCIFNKFFTCV